MKPGILFLTIGLVARAVVAQTGGGVLPVGPEAHSLVYDRMEWVQALSPDGFDYQLGPYPANRLQLTGTPFEDFASVSGTQLMLFSVVGENFTSMRHARANGLEAIRGGLALRPLERVFVYGNFILDEARAKDPSYLGKKWRGLAGDVEQAFAAWQTDRFDLTAGRFASFWGNRRSLILGPEVCLDGFGYTFRWGKLTFSYRMAKLDAVRHAVDTVAQVENRYFAGHRIDFHVSDHVRLGAFETVVFGGPGRQIELYYLNPLIFFHGSQVNEGANDNTFVGLDFSVVPAVGYHVYGQALIDDYQIERKSPEDREPNELGLLVGAYAADVLPGYDVRVEYGRVTNRTFNQNLSRNRYLFDNQLISGALGNDYERTEVRVIRWFGDWTAATAQASLLRQGQGKVSDSWSEPWLEATGDYREKFPTGVVEKTASISIGLKSYFKKFATVDVEAGVDKVSNAGHVSGDARTRPFVHLSVSGFLSTLIDVQ